MSKLSDLIDKNRAGEKGIAIAAPAASSVYRKTALPAIKPTPLQTMGNDLAQFSSALPEKSLAKVQSDTLDLMQRTQTAKTAKIQSMLPEPLEMIRNQSISDKLAQDQELVLRKSSDQQLEKMRAQAAGQAARYQNMERAIGMGAMVDPTLTVEEAHQKALSYEAKAKELEAEQKRRKDAAYYAKQSERVAALEEAQRASDFQSAAQTGRSAYSSIPVGTKYEALRRAVKYLTTGKGATANKSTQLTQAEGDTVLYYVGRGEYDAAADYLDALDRTLNRRANEDTQEKAAQWAQEHPVLGAAANVASWPLNIPAFAANTAQAVKNAVTGEYEPTDLYSNAFLGARVGAGTSQGVAEAARKWGTDTFGSQTAGEVTAFLAQTGLSIGQNATQIALLGPASLGAMGLSAAGTATTDALERGATPNQAFLVGTANGAIEVITEKVPLDNLLSIASKSGKQTAGAVVRSVLDQMWGEAKEEMVSEIADNLVDAMVMGDKSEFTQYVQQLTAQGMSEEEARKKALLQFYLYNVLSAGAGGAISGGVMMGGAQLFNQAGYYADMLREDKAAKTAQIQTQEQGQAQTPPQGENGQIGAAAGQETGQTAAGPVQTSASSASEDTGAAPLPPQEGAAGPSPTVSSAAQQTNARPPAGEQAATRQTSPIDMIANWDNTERMKDNGTGDIVSDGGQGRVPGQGAGEQGGTVEGRADAAAKAAQQSRTAVERQDLAKSLQLQEVGPRSLGVEQGVETPSLRVLPAEHLDRELKTAAFKVYQATGRGVDFVLGGIRVAALDGSEAIVRGVNTLQSNILVQADHLRVSATQIADHEVFHDLAARSPGILGEMEQRIVDTYSQEELDRVLDVYIQKLRGVISLDENAGDAEIQQAYTAALEELCADAYAGINAFGANAPTFNAAVEQALTDKGLGRMEQTDAPRQPVNLVDLLQGDTGQQQISSEADSKGRQLTKEQNEYFKNSKVRDENGDLKVMYHGTSRYGFTVFDVYNGKFGLFGKGSYFTDSKSVAESYTNKGNGPQKGVYEVYLNIENPINMDAPADVSAWEEGNKDVDFSGCQTNEDCFRALSDYCQDEQMVRWEAEELITDTIIGMGYDGITHMGGGRVNKDGERHQVYIAFEPEQIKRVDNIEPTGRSDIRFSLDDDADAQRQKDELTDTVFGFRHVEPVGETGQTRVLSDNSPSDPAAPDTSGAAETAGEQTATRDKKVKPTTAKKDLRKTVLDLFSIPAGSRAELGELVDQFADRMLKTGKLTDDDRSAFFDRLYEEGMMEIPADEYYQIGREAVRGGRVYVDEKTRHEFADDWNSFRKRAFAAGVYFTGSSEDAHIDQWNAELAESLPGLFSADELDDRAILERIVQVAEEGKSEKMSLSEYAARLVGDQVMREDEVLDDLERQLDWALNTFAEKAKLEVDLKKRQKASQNRDRARRQKAAQSNKEKAALRSMQQNTLKSLQWLKKNRKSAPADLQETIDSVLGDIDVYAASAADLLRYSKKRGATWQDLAEMYASLSNPESPNYDPAFVQSKEMQKILSRVQGLKVGDMSVNDLENLYKAAVGVKHEIESRHRLLVNAQETYIAELYRDSVREVGSAAGGAKNGAVAGWMDRFLNWEQLTPMNALERMGGWNKDGSFYSMAKELEEGERQARDYKVRADRMLEQFLTEERKWVKRADGQGRKGQWYQVQAQEITQRGHGDAPILGDTVTVWMTPVQKVHLYLESKCYDNLRHMELGGRTFADRELYSKGKRAEAFDRGVTVKLSPHTVQQLVSDLTPQEQALADVLEKYYNVFSKERINETSNILYGYDRAMNDHYAPIFTNQNYTSTVPGIYDITAEGAGHMKERQHGTNPTWNISALDAFERHVDQTSRWTGLSAPIRDMNSLMNWRDRNTSMRDVLTHKWGGEATRYIDSLLEELNGGKRTERDGPQIMDTALSNYISSVFGANPAIVIKQAMSFPLASAYLGWSSAPNIFAALNTSDELIGTYTSELAYRLLGYSTPETAQLKNDPSALSENRFLKDYLGGGWITKMDGITVKSIWRWAENAVRKDNSDLEVGSREMVEAGNSPFYQEVARRFEEAVSRSQPMYDTMHRSQIMRRKGAGWRALTLFKTVPQQQLNMLRQTAGEAAAAGEQFKKAQKQVKEKAISQEAYAQIRGEYVQAKRTAGRAVTGVIFAGLGIEAVNLLMALWKNKGKKYRDEDGELTAASAGLEFMQGFIKDNLGMVAGGDLLADAAGSLITGDKWYGIETPGITQLDDIITEIINAGKGLSGLVDEAADVVKNGGDLGAYFKRHSGDILGAAESTASTAAAYLGGIPANNLKTYILGALSWVSPEIKTAYEDLLATADKSGLKDLTGEALEVRVSDILKNRLGSADGDTVSILAGLYAAGYTGAVPGDTPDSVSVNSEDRKLSASQRQFYDTAWRDAIGEALPALVGSENFQGAGEELQSKMLKKLYDYAAARAKGALFEDYYADAWVGEAAQDQDGAADWIAWHILSQKEAQSSQTGEKEYAPTVFDKFTTAGLEKGDALSAVKAIQELEPLEGKTSVSDNQKYLAVAELELDQESTDAAMKALMVPADEDSSEAWSDYQLAMDAGVDPVTYAKWKIDIAWLEADKDADGEAVSGSLKAKVVDSIEDLDVGNDQMAALYATQYESDYDKLTKAGLSTEKALKAAWAMGRLDPEAGKSEPSSYQRYVAIAGAGLGNADTDKAMKTIMDATSKTAYDDYKSAVDAGISRSTYCRWLQEISGLSSTKDANGKDVKGQTKQDKVCQSIAKLDLTREQKDLLYLTQYSASNLSKNRRW